MIEGLQRFRVELRRAGLRASPAEWIEALRAVDLVGVEHRDRFRQALRATLAKDASQCGVFDATFESFFAAPCGARRRQRRAGSGVGASPPAEPETTSAAGDRRSGAARPGEARHAEPRRDPAEPREPQRDQEERTESQREAERDKTGGIPFAQQMRSLQHGGRGRLGRLRRLVTAAETSNEESRRGALCDQARPERRPLARRGSSEEDRELARALRRLVERIRLRSARRLRRRSSGRPYLRRIFRESSRTGGVPFRLPRRRRRQETPRVVLLVDVSWSTARAAGLFLEMAAEFLRLGRQTRVLLFVDRPLDVTEAYATWCRRGGRGFARWLSLVPGLNLHAPSDYGRASSRTPCARSCRAGRGAQRTLLLVLGDGRTNRFDPQDVGLRRDRRPLRQPCCGWSPRATVRLG